MAPRSSLAIATAAVLRLVKEEQYYHKELADQEAKIAAAEASGTAPGGVDDENAEFMLRQQRQALAETKAMFACMRDKISAAVEKLEAELAAAGESEEAGPAKEALEKGRVALKDATTAEA